LDTVKLLNDTHGKLKVTVEFPAKEGV
jgi:hypothetical protein